MILKTNDGTFVELTDKDYIQFVAELLVHFNTEQKLLVNWSRDARVDAAKMLLDTVATSRNTMSKEVQDDYFKTAHELIDSYNNEKKSKSIL